MVLHVGKFYWEETPSKSPCGMTQDLHLYCQLQGQVYGVLDLHNLLYLLIKKEVSKSIFMRLPILYAVLYKNFFKTCIPKNKIQIPSLTFNIQLNSMHAT
jgi:hypothetical protein